MSDRDPTAEQARRLAAVIAAAPDPAACAACLDALEDYVGAQVAGEDYVARFPAVARHLDSCLACAESYGLLYKTRLNEASLPAPARVPLPDLAFLGAGSLRAALAAAVERLGRGLRLTLSPALLGLLPPPAGPALAFRSSEETAPPLFELELERLAGEVAGLRLNAYVEDAAAGMCMLRVQVELHGRAWPDLAGVPVVLATGVGQRRALTDAWGEAVFASVPREALPQLTIIVEP